MPAHYVNVTQEEMEEHLLPQGFKRVTVAGTTELVYGKRVDREGLQLTLRVYTGIVPSGNSRGVGEDAMRCTIFWRSEDGVVKMVGGSKRVHRVRGWRKNLQNRIDTWHELLGPKCPECGQLMVERDGRNGKFFGCTGYPECKKTLPLSHRPDARHTLSREECEAEAEIREIKGSQM
jgi:hypothetical protein